MTVADMTAQQDIPPTRRRISEILKPRVSFFLDREVPAKAVEDGNCIGHELFEVADELEKGLVDDAVLQQMVTNPVSKSKGLQRFNIISKDEAREHHLLSQAGDVLLVARYVPRHRRFDLYTDVREIDASLTPCSASGNSTSDRSVSPCRRRAAFVLANSESADEWVLTQSRCDYCMHKPRHLTCESVGKRQQVACMRHSRVPVHEVKCHSLRVYVPPLLDGRRNAVWCPLWTGVDLGSKGGPSTPQFAASPYSRASPHVLDLLPEAGDEALFIRSVLPNWDEEVESLVVNFKGRTIVSSARNFMLCKADDKDCNIILQFGRLSDRLWCLDFAYPLSAVQAFGIALSSIHWD